MRRGEKQSDFLRSFHRNIGHLLRRIIEFVKLIALDWLSVRQAAVVLGLSDHRLMLTSWKNLYAVKETSQGPAKVLERWKEWQEFLVVQLGETLSFSKPTKFYHVISHCVFALWRVRQKKRCRIWVVHRRLKILVSI